MPLVAMKKLMEKNDDVVMDFLDSAYDGFPLMEFLDGKNDGAYHGAYDGE